MHRKKGSLRDPMLDDVTDFKNMDEVMYIQYYLFKEIKIFSFTNTTLRNQVHMELGNGVVI